ncbi:MAG: integrase arm-type DNA-binding domain-containing protein [Marinosulfonomonas sp.]|nr:integrase arm-type DNA-binding domain-containing protein [Marinosulfonomonas sp.]
MPKLTKSVVDSVELRSGEYVVWCNVLPGFGFRVRNTGVKSFIVQYRVGGRRSPVRKKTIGQFGKLTAQQARDVARKYLAEAELGRDLVAEEMVTKRSLTVGQLCEEYMKRGTRNKKPSTLATDSGRIKRHINPLLGKKLVIDISQNDITRFLHNVADGKTAVDIKTGKNGRSIVTGGKGTATRTVRLLGGIFSYCPSSEFLVPEAA